MSHLFPVGLSVGAPQVYINREQMSKIIKITNFLLPNRVKHYHYPLHLLRYLAAGQNY